MEQKELLELIRAVSNSNIADFQYEQGETKVIISAFGSQSAVTSQEVMQPVVEQMKVPVSDAQTVKAPLVGTFYAAPSEEAAPYVQVGDKVKKGQTLGIVEAMKLMNEIESEYDGVVVEVCVKNGAMVEYGQPLFRIS